MLHRCLNEWIARKANAEDRCTGAFWEARFKSQALLDERALLTCMAYVDLNPVRAAMANTPEQSDYTSVQQRLEDQHSHTLPLVQFRDESKDPEKALPMYLRDYLELVDWTGRCRHTTKRGRIPEHLKPILERIGFDEASWIQGYALFGRPRFTVIGPPQRMERMAQRTQRAWYKGISLQIAPIKRQNL